MRGTAFRLLVTGLFLCTLAACQISGTPARVEAPADSAAGEISFELAGLGGAALVVPVYLNGEGPWDFVLDTGATYTCVSDTLARQLELPEKQGQIGFGSTLAGSGRMRLVGIDSFRVGAAKAFDLTACAVDLSALEAGGLDARGLIGLNFLKSFRVTLDFERQVLQLQKP